MSIGQVGGMFTEWQDRNMWSSCTLNMYAICMPIMCAISWCVMPHRFSFVLWCLILELYLILLPVFIQIHWGMGWFCFCFLARNRLILKVLWEHMVRNSPPHTLGWRWKGEKLLKIFKKIFYLFIREKECVCISGAGGRGEKDAGSLLNGELDMGLNLRTLRSWPETKADI